MIALFLKLVNPLNVNVALLNGYLTPVTVTFVTLDNGIKEMIWFFTS